MKNVFDGLINILNVAEERISELEAISIETSKREKHTEKKKKVGKKKREIEYLRTMGQLHKCIHNIVQR